jgi:hypothetical protein
MQVGGQGRRLQQQPQQLQLRQLVLCIGQGFILWLGLQVELQVLVVHPHCT